MKKYIIILFTGLSFLSHAQKKLNGYITDNQNQPLFGVEVYIAELQKGTSTNEKGYYEIQNLPNTTINVTTAFIGYETQSKTVHLENDTTELNFVLNETIFKMEEIIISTPFNKLQSENVMKVEKATVELLKSKGSATLIDGVNSIAGVSNVSTGVGIGKPVIRGLRGNRVLVYSQGVRLENQQFGDEHGLGVDESSIESVEVIKGPASLLYGSDALGGVLYFNPVKFAEANTFNFNVSEKYFSNTEGSNTSIGFKQSYDKWKFLVNGAYNMHSDYKIPDGDRVTNTRFNEITLNSGIGFNSAHVSSTLRFGFNATKVGIPEEIGVQSNQKTPMLPYQDLKTKLLSLNNIFFLNKSKIVTTFGYTENTRKEFEDEHHHHEDEEAVEEEHEHEHEHETVTPALHLELNTFSYDAKWHLPKFNNIETIFGVQGLHQENKNYGEEILIPNAITNDFGVFFTGSYSWKKNTFQGGLRFDTRNIETEQHVVSHEDEEHIFAAIDKSFENFTASLGFKTKLFDEITTRINVASGFKAPNLAELTSNGIHHGSNRYEIGNDKLGSEQNIQTDVALEYNSTHFEIFANGFYNYITDYIFISPTGEIEDGTPVYKYVQDDAKLYGGEFGIHIHPHPLDWLHLNSGFEFVIGKQNNGNYLPLIPAHKLTNTLRSEFDIKNWLKKGFASVSLESTFKQNNISEFETPSKSYNLVNIGTGGTLKVKDIDLNVNLNVNNVFDTSYISHLSRLKSNNIPNIGRNFMVGVDFKF